MAYTTTQLLSALLMVDGRATEGGILELPSNSRLLLDVIVEGVERGDLLGDIAAAVAEAQAARDAAVIITGISSTDSAVAALVQTVAGPLTQAALEAKFGAGEVDLSGGNVTLTAVTVKAYKLTGATATRTVTVPNAAWAASFTNSTDYEQVVIRSGSTVGARIPAGATAELRG